MQIEIAAVISAKAKRIKVAVCQPKLFCKLEQLLSKQLQWHTVKFVSIHFSHWTVIVLNVKCARIFIIVELVDAM